MNVFQKVFTSIAAAVLLSAGGYFLWQQGTLLNGADDTTVTVAAGNELMLREVTQSRHEDVEGTGGCDVRMLYPQIEETTGISSEIRDGMNADITRAVKEFLTTNDVGLDIAATDFVTSCKDDLVDLVNNMNDPIESAQQAWTSEIGYDVKQNKNGILSIGLSNYLNQGGAHPNTTQLFVTFDVKTGKQLLLRNVIDSEKITAFEVKEKQWIVDNESDQLFEESLNEFKAYIAAPTDEVTNRYIDDALFYLTPDAVGTYYNPYSIAPYVAGPISVEIPRAELGM